MTERRLRIDQAVHVVSLESSGDAFTLREGARVVSGRRRWSGARLELEVEGRLIEAHVTRGVRGALELWLGSERYVLEEERGGAAGAGASAEGSEEDELLAPMPAKIVRVLVAAGDAVADGQTLVVLESMKMELGVSAPRDGRVRRVGAREGEIVATGALLVELDPLGGASTAG